MQKIAVLAAVQKAHHNGSNAYGDVATNASPTDYNGSSSTGKTDGSRFHADLHGNVNILLGGAMISGVIMVVVLICYCCHKNVRKHRPQEYSQYWRTDVLQPDAHSLEVFTMDAHAACYDRSANRSQEEGPPTSLPPCPLTSGPPPAYESLMFDPRTLPSPTDKKDESDDPASIIAPPANGPPSESEANRINKQEDVSRDDREGLPSYEAALKLEADGYV